MTTSQTNYPTHSTLKRATEFLSRQNGYGLKTVITAVLLTGLYIHVSILFLWHDLVVQHIVTPAFDMLLTIPLTFAAIACWLAAPQVRFLSNRQRFAYGFVTFYFSISVPVHVRTYFVQSTELLKAFPVWYSLAIIPVMIWMLIFVRKLQFKQDTN